MRRLAVPEYRVAEQIVNSLAITGPKSMTDNVLPRSAATAPCAPWPGSSVTTMPLKVALPPALPSLTQLPAPSRLRSPLGNALYRTQRTMVLPPAPSLRSPLPEYVVAFSQSPPVGHVPSVSLRSLIARLGNDSPLATQR